MLYITSYKDFYFDEWDFIISRRPWTLQIFILPRFYYMSAIPILVWKLLFVVVGLRSYVPYEATLLLTDIAAVLLLFALIRRRSGDLPAFAAALTLLVFGGGSYDIVFAFQICFVGAIAFGLLAMLLIQDASHFARRVIAISLALTAGLMCHVLELAFIVAIFIEVGIDPRRRRLLLALVAPVVALLAWYLAFDTGSIAGTPGVSTELLRGPAGLALVAGLVGFVLAGAEATAAAVFGFGVQVGVAALALLAGLITWTWGRQGKIESWQLGMVAGLLTFFLLTGLGRLQFGASYASQTRYIYVGAVFLLPLIAHAARELPWRGIWRPALSLVFAAILVANVVQLGDAARSQVELMTVENAELQTVEYFRSAPDMSMGNLIDASTMWALHAGEYLAARDELGSPVPPLTASNLPNLPSWAVDRVMVNLFGDALTVSSSSSEALSLPCRNVDSSTASTLAFQVPDSQTILLQSSRSGYADLSLGFLNPPASPSLKRVDLQASKPLFLRLPNTGKPAVWQLWIRTTDVGELRVCSEVAPAVTRLSRYEDLAATFTSGPDWWPYVKDAAASSQWSSKGAAGTQSPDGAYGDSFTPIPGAYDIWYRVRVAADSSTKPEMILTVVDLNAGEYWSSASFSPSQVGTTYRWMLVASNVTPVSNHALRFQVNVAAQMSTDWYIDEAAMVPASTPMPPSG
jgi:hypothetical protein